MNQKIHYYMDLEELFVGSTFTIDDVFKDSCPFLFVLNQEEKDYYSGLQLMYGKTLNILTMDEWEHQNRMRILTSHYNRTGFISNTMPSFYYSTYLIDKD